MTHFRSLVTRNKPVATSAQTRGEGFSGLIGPESYDITGWETRVTEAFLSALKHYVDDLHRLPSVEEYREIAIHAVENPAR